jgi:3-hydroxyisobutyrate dehydrogenase
MAHIAFIGLGNMGQPMVGNLVQAGHQVTGFDVAAALCDAAGQQGVTIAESTAAAVMDAEIVITMLPAGSHVMAVYGDALPAARPTSLFIDCSTIGVDKARAAHQLARAASMQSIDAPVSGGTSGAKAATLTFMCGGDDDAFRAAKDVLGAMGKRIIHCGPAGSGQAAKLCNNMILGVTMIATAEAFVLAEAIGLSHQALFDVASTSSGQSWSLTSCCPVPGPVPNSPANRNYAPSFAAALMLKDLRLAQEAAAAEQAATPLGAAAAQIYALYSAAGEGSTDFSGIINFLRGVRSAR